MVLGKTEEAKEIYCLRQQPRSEDYASTMLEATEEAEEVIEMMKLVKEVSPHSAEKSVCRIRAIQLLPQSKELRPELLNTCDLQINSN